MPTRSGHDSKGCYYQWGNQTKHYYKCGNKKERERAKKRADADGRRIYQHGYKG